MIVNLSVRYCETMRDTEDFLLFGIEITTAYSSSIVPKRFEDFKRFHEELAYFWNSKQKTVKLIDLIPTLPGCTSSPSKMKARLNKYASSLLKILQNPLFNKFHPWIKIINKFFKVQEIETDEESKAIFIQNSFKLFCTKKKREKNQNIQITSLTYQTLQKILIFLKPNELETLKAVSQTFKAHAKQVLVFNYLSKSEKNCELKKIDFSNSGLATVSILCKIFTQCNPNTLQHLNLSNCSTITDDSLSFLNYLFPVPNFQLSYLNLNKCKITDTSISTLKIFTQLKQLELQECLIFDHSVQNIPEFFPYLKTLNISGTEITHFGLNRLSCSQIENLIISNCKNINFLEVRKCKFVKFITACEDFVIELTHELTKESILVQGNKNIQVKDICDFLKKKLGTNLEVNLKFEGKIVKMYQHLINLPQENCTLRLNFCFIHREWPGLPVWVSKEKVLKCSHCQKNFSWYNRKVNCRMCGKIFCSDCCKTKKFIEKFGYTKSKVPTCFNCCKSKI